MEGKKAIVERILSDAEEQAKSILKDAKIRKQAEQDAARQEAAEYLEKSRRALKSEAENQISRRETVAALDCRKLLLQAKREVLESVIQAAQKKACKMPKEKYLKVLEKLLKENAETGDEIVLSESAPVGEREVMALAVCKERKLSFAATVGKFSGGLILVSDKCDKDCSFEALFEANRNELEEEIAGDLFADKK